MALAALFFVSMRGYGQVDLPHNLDGDSNGFIGSSDLQSILAVYGDSFDPGLILVDSVELSLVIHELQEQIALLQVESLFRCGDKMEHHGYLYQTVQIGSAC